MNAVHKSTYWTTGRPRSHWRKCSCGWSTSGMMSAKVARELFEAHLAEVAVRIEKREQSMQFTTRTKPAYEWVIALPDGRRKITRTRREAVEWCADMGYEVVS